MHGVCKSMSEESIVADVGLMQSLPKRTRETRFDWKQATEIEKQGLFNVLEEYMRSA